MKVKRILKKDDIRPNEGTFCICIHSILNIKQKITENNYNYLTNYQLIKHTFYLNFSEAWVEVVIDKQHRTDLIQAYHAGIVGSNSVHTQHSGGHVGQNKTLYKLISSYYWANIKQDVANYVSSCNKCQGVHTSHWKKSIKHSIPL